MRKRASLLISKRADISLDFSSTPFGHIRRAKLNLFGHGLPPLLTVLPLPRRCYG